MPGMLLLGMPPHTALGTNKMVGIATAIASSFQYTRARAVLWKEILGACLSALVFSLLGAYVATAVDPDVLKPVILIGLIFATVLFFVRRGFQDDALPRVLHGQGWIVLMGAFLGFYDGFFGPGTGTFLMMGFVLLFGHRLLNASANSRIINLCTNVGALLWFGFSGHVELMMVLPASVASFIGGTVGARLSVKNGAKVIRPVLIVVILLMITKISLDMWNAT